jgi:hypothetical protein
MDGTDSGATVALSGTNDVERLQAMLEAPQPDPSNTDGAEAEAPNPDDPGPEGDAGDGPAEEQVTGKRDGGEGDPDQPVIAAPKSWPAEMRQRFAELPPDLQQVIADRETEQTAAFNRQVNEAAERRKAAEAEISAASNERQQYLAQLSTMIDGLAYQTAGEFADIRTTADLETLAATDPQRYLRWQARRDAIQTAQGEQARLLERQHAEDTSRLRGYADEQRRLLVGKIPEFGDPKAARTLQAQMNDYLRGHGFTDEETSGWFDHRYALVIRDAMLYRKGQQAAKTAADKKVADKPRMLRPGVGSDSRGERSSQEKAALTRIARHGTTDQQAEALARLLEGN